MSKEDIFSSFKIKCNEILEHEENIKELKFKAKLSNGISFDFKFDQQEYDKKTNPNKYEANSITNAILDIIAFGLTITLLSVSNVHSVFVVLIYVINIIYFPFSCFANFLSKNKYTANTIVNLLKNILATILITMYSVCFSELYSSFNNLTPLFSVLGFIAIFLHTLKTKGAHIAANAINIIICIIPILVASEISIYTVLIFFTLSISSIISILSCSIKKMDLIKNTSLFYFTSLFLFFFFS